YERRLFGKERVALAGRARLHTVSDAYQREGRDRCDDPRPPGAATRQGGRVRGVRSIVQRRLYQCFSDQADHGMRAMEMQPAGSRRISELEPHGALNPFLGKTLSQGDWSQAREWRFKGTSNRL